MYFMVSGTDMRASSQMWKKLSTVVRDVKMTAEWDRISTLWARNSFKDTPSTRINGLYATSTWYFWASSWNGDFSMTAGLGCETNTLFTFNVTDV